MRVRSSASTPAQPSGEEEARSFLQERLAFLGKTYVLIDLSFFLVSRLVGAPLRASLKSHRLMVFSGVDKEPDSELSIE